jgi:hypothetical protein
MYETRSETTDWVPPHVSWTVDAVTVEVQDPLVVPLWIVTQLVTQACVVLGVQPVVAEAHG